MLKNPYPPPSDLNEHDLAACRFQTYIDAGDRALLMSLRAVRGTAQAAVNTLILNLCNDLRELKLISYRPDADDILEILVERRPLTDDQISRLRLTSIGLHQEIPTWLQQHRGRTAVRKGASDPKTKSADPKSEVKSGVGRDRGQTASETKKSTKETHERRGHS